MPIEELIELREQNKNSIKNDIGDYSVSLGAPLQINKGDQIQIKSVFIDTVSKNSGRIMVDENETNVTFNVGLYIQDSNTTRETAAVGKTYYEAEASTEAAAASTRPNGKNYVLCSKDDIASGSGGVEMLEVSALLITDQSDNDRFIPDQHRRLYLQYKDVNGNIIDYWLEITGQNWAKISPGIGQTKSYNASSGSWEHAPVLPVLVMKDGFGSGVHMRINPNKMGKEGTGKDYAHNSQWSFSGIPSNTPILSNTALFTPWIFPISIVIPYKKEGYDPVEFARLMTDSLTKTETTTDGSLQSNKLLQSTAELKARGSKNYSGASDNVNPFWCAEDGSDLMQYNNNNNYIVGSSQFAIGYDLETNIFTIDAIHSSIYDGGSPCVVPYTVNSKSFILNKATGIFIDSINMTDILIEQMNFNTSIFAKPYGHLKNTSLTTITDCTIPLYRLFDGVQITGARKDIDIYIPKGSNPANHAQTYDTAPVFNLPTNTQPASIITEDVSKIYSTQSNVVTNDQAYFQLEIESNYLIRKYSNEVNSTKIHGIINKYYSTENYTTGSTDSGMVYIHNQTDPILIKDFRCRILNPDGSASSSDIIQDDNTVFLQIIRN